MKKYFLGLLVVSCVFLSGCSFKKDKDILKKVVNKIDNCKSYYLTGNLEMINNETSYKYDVNVSYSKDNNFKVSLKNNANNHEQIILRNEDGVYVITPSLNKSFKFQSDWPYNNSQSYLLQMIIKDLRNDEDTKYEIVDNKYIYTSKVNYSNNKDLVKQKVVINKDAEIEKVEVLDNEENVKIRMIFSDIDFNAKFNDDYYKLEQNVGTITESSSEVSSLDDINYPMYIPLNTSLTSQDRIKTSGGERVILTFSGENPFTLIEECASIEKEFTVVPINGELVVLGDSIGVMDDTSITWITTEKQYYLVSSTLDSMELLEVARSIGSIPVIK